MQINAQFQKFVDFATAAHAAGNDKSIARAGESTALEGRTITAATTDRVAAFIRSRANKSANNVARDLFRQAVIDMFGDELSAFVTKGAKTSYADLDTKERNKVHIVISFLSQECGKAVFDGQATAFDPKNAEPPFVPASDQASDEREFTIGFDKNGDFQFDFFGRMNLQVITTRTGDGRSATNMVNEGSTLEAEVSFKIPAGEFERMSGLDFTKFDDSATQAHMDNRSIARRLEKLPSTFGEEFRLNADVITCDTRIHAEFK